MSQFAYAEPLGREDIRRGAHATRARLTRLTRLLDSAFRVPGTSVRVGLDAVLNLFPIAGQVITNGLSAYLIYEARRLGAPPSLILRMAGNIGLDFLISAVPVVGWIGDVFYRANTKNLALLNEFLDRIHPPPVYHP